VVLLGGSLAHLVVQGLAGHLGGEGVVGGLSKGADLLALVLPHSGGAAQVVSGIVVLLQLALVQLLAQLHNITSGHVAVVVGSDLVINGLGVIATAGDIVVLDVVDDSDVTHGDGA